MSACHLELAELARTAGDEVAVQHHLQHAEHWYRMAMTDERSRTDPLMAIEGEALAD
jgi:hypothetical protein